MAQLKTMQDTTPFQFSLALLVNTHYRLIAIQYPRRLKHKPLNFESRVLTPKTTLLPISYQKFKAYNYILLYDVFYSHCLVSHRLAILQEVTNRTCLPVSCQILTMS